MLDILVKGLQGLHFFVNDLERPIVVATYSKKEEMYVLHLEHALKKGEISNESILFLCQQQRLYYKVYNFFDNTICSGT